MSSNQAPSLEVGGGLGRFELLLPIARGGMAQVWAARLPGTRGFRKIVALKTLHSGASDIRLEDMLLEEAKLASQIVHPNVVATHELGEDRGILYLVMEWVDGLPLSEIIREEPSRRLSIPIAVQLFAQVCRGLHAAHELRDEHDQPLGLVHRDISPQNILVERRGIAKIVDFGVAKATNRDSGLTEDGELKGKIAYMAPEQLAGEKVDRRTDIFALGCVFYLLTTGRHPFRGQTVAETVQNICSGSRPTPPTQLCDGFPAPLEEILFKALSARPSDRHSSAQDLLAELEHSFHQFTQSRYEQAVGEHLEKSVGDKLRLRREQLRHAQDDLDGSSAGAVPSGTMRALTLANVPIPGEAAQASGSSSSISRSEVVDFRQGTRSLPLRSISIAVVALCSVIAAQVAFLKSESSEGGEAARPAASAVAPQNSAVTIPMPEPAVVSADVVEEDAPAPATHVEEGEKEESKTSSKASTRRPTRTRVPVGQIAKPTPPASPAPLPAASSPQPSPSAPQEKQKVDAWDLDAFGDRH